jgi:hypothetical protein
MRGQPLNDSANKPSARPLGVVKATATVVKAGDGISQLVSAVDDMLTTITMNGGLSERAGGLNEAEVEKLCRVRRLLIKVAREEGLSLL